MSRRVIHTTVVVLQRVRKDLLLKLVWTDDHTHASRRYEKVYYSHNGIFCKSRAWLSFHGD